MELHIANVSDAQQVLIVLAVEVRLFLKSDLAPSSVQSKGHTCSCRSHT